MPSDSWVAGDAYEAYMGRWSRLLARAFAVWLSPQRQAHWLEFGCGTGALTAALCEHCEPASIVACDPSQPFLEYARKGLSDARVSFVAAGAESLPRRDGGFDSVVSGLVLNFLTDPGAAVASARERLRPGGMVAACVWDYAEGMELLRAFWDTAAETDPRAAALDEGRRFPLCRPPALASLFRSAGLTEVVTQALDIPTRFTSFEDYWTPFLRGTGPAPGYVASLDPQNRESLRERLRLRLHAESDEPIHFQARAWAVRGIASPG
jgi:SAM-dependent methyltransferase